MKTFVIIPAYNEATRIAETLQLVLEQKMYNIVVVDDGSKDETYSKSASLVTTLRHRLNRGMGAALATGTQYALSQGADYIVHFDADGQHDASEIKRFLSELEKKDVDIVLGSRYLQRNKLPWTKKYLIHKPAQLFQNMMTGIHLTDVHNGFRALNRFAAQKIRITQDRMAHNSEIINEIAHHHLRYCEVPVTIHYREYGQGFFDGIKILKELIIKKLSH